MASPSVSLDNYLFGPVSAQYCIWFYIISIIGFIMMCFVLLGFIISLFMKKVHFSVPLTFFMALFSWFFMYFQNRLLYNMCLKSEA
jgi:hypothetical protein